MKSNKYLVKIAENLNRQKLGRYTFVAQNLDNTSPDHHVFESGNGSFRNIGNEARKRGVMGHLSDISTKGIQISSKDGQVKITHSSHGYLYEVISNQKDSIGRNSPVVLISKHRLSPEEAHIKLERFSSHVNRTLPNSVWKNLAHVDTQMGKRLRIIKGGLIGAGILGIGALGAFGYNISKSKSSK